VRLRVLAVTLLIAFLTVAPGTHTAWASTPVATDPPPTVNPFLPEERGLGDCISAVPKPGCGSEERGGWHQYLVAIALVGGLTFVGWRIVSGVRKSPNRSTH